MHIGETEINYPFRGYNHDAKLKHTIGTAKPEFIKRN